MQTLVGNLCSPKPWGGPFSAGRCRPTTGLHARQSRPSARRVPGIVPGTGYPGSTSPELSNQGDPACPHAPVLPRCGKSAAGCGFQRVVLDRREW